MACACLDTSRRRFAPPSQAHPHQPKNGTNENPKPSDAESSAKPLGRSSAFTLGGFLDFSVFVPFFSTVLFGLLRLCTKRVRILPLRLLEIWDAFLLSLYRSVPAITVTEDGLFILNYWTSPYSPEGRFSGPIDLKIATFRIRI